MAAALAPAHSNAEATPRAGSTECFVYTANFDSDDVTRIAADGTTAASWASVGNGPYGIAVDGDGNVYTANALSNTVSKILPGGLAAGSPWPVATGSAPRGVAVDGDGNVFVANNSGSITKIAPNGSAVTNWATTGDAPNRIAVDADGNVYTPNFSSDSVTKILANGSPAGSPWPVATGLSPYGLAIDSSGNVFVGNTGTDSVTKISANGTANANWASTGDFPSGVATDANGNVYTANVGSGDVSKILPTGTPAGGAWPVSTGSNPEAVAVDKDGNVYAANGPTLVTKITPGGTAAPFGTDIGLAVRDIALSPGCLPPKPDPPAPTAAKIASATVTGPSKAKRRKVVTYRVAVANSGETAANAVKLKVSGKGTTGGATVGTIAGKSSKTTAVKVRFRKKGRIRATFKVSSANAGSKSAAKRVRVR